MTLRGHELVQSIAESRSTLSIVRRMPRDSPEHAVATVAAAVLPQPADAADALALALCHAWRVGAPAAGGREPLTPAQRAWLDAERVSRR